MGMSFDLNGKYLYVAAYTANAVDGFTIGASGAACAFDRRRAACRPGRARRASPSAGRRATRIPRHAVYLYTSNALSNNLTGEQVNQQDGSLAQMQGTPFGGSALPTCVVTVPALPLRN